MNIKFPTSTKTKELPEERIPPKKGDIGFVAQIWGSNVIVGGPITRVVRAYSCNDVDLIDVESPARKYTYTIRTKMFVYANEKQKAMYILNNLTGEQDK